MTITKELLEALKAALEWIDGVPSDTPLPTMIGFDRDLVDALIAKAESAVSEPAIANPAKVPDALLGYLEQIETTLDYVTREGQNTFTVNEALQQLRKAIDLRVIEVAKAGFKYALTPPAEAKREPLTEDKRLLMFSTLYGTSAWGGREFYLQGIADAESAHNIGAKE